MKHDSLRLLMVASLTILLASACTTGTMGTAGIADPTVPTQTPPVEQ